MEAWELRNPIDRHHAEREEARHRASTYKRQVVRCREECVRSGAFTGMDPPRKLNPTLDDYEETAWFEQNFT